MFSGESLQLFLVAIIFIGDFTRRFSALIHFPDAIIIIALNIRLEYIMINLFLICFLYSIENSFLHKCGEGVAGYLGVTT